MPYRAPLADITHALNDIAGLGAAIEAGRLGDLSADMVDAILAEAGRFADERLTPLLRSGDRPGARFSDGAVTMPPGWTEAYRAWREAGWNGLTGPETFGGQGLPTMLSVATLELWNSASSSFAIGPTLTIGAIEALVHHGSDALKADYLEKLVTGEWMGTMNLTEPQAGSDLALLMARAERAGDGTYRIFGTKIFITFGEHDLSENIVHLVLARLPDAPSGTRGISLFLVPKFLVGPDGALGARNDVRAAGIEHKMGLHGSPTCTMIFGDAGGAVGYLVGEEHRGLACMFTMMNNARLAVGIQGVAIAEAATQHALAYARDRKQGRARGAATTSAIIEHPDVRRMLLTQKALTAAARAICHVCAHAIDMGRLGEGTTAWADRAGILTPLAKAFSSEIGVEVSSLGVQIHGGMGYIEETGAAQFLRDARIAPIYEGTNGIQAIDLVTRKLPLSGGAAWAAFLGELEGEAVALAAFKRPDLGRTSAAVAEAVARLRRASASIIADLEREPDAALAVATPFLRLASLAAGGAFLSRGVRATITADRAEASARIALTRFYAEHVLSETAALEDCVTGGAAAILAADAVFG